MRNSTPLASRRSTYPRNRRPCCARCLVRLVKFVVIKIPHLCFNLSFSFSRTQTRLAILAVSIPPSVCVRCLLCPCTLLPAFVQARPPFIQVVHKHCLFAAVGVAFVVFWFIRFCQYCHAHGRQYCGQCHDNCA